MAVVTTFDSPSCCMPCQDKSTIKLKFSILSVNKWRRLSPGVPIFHGVSSNVFPFGFFVCFRAAPGAGSTGKNIQPLQRLGFRLTYPKRK
ncbi:hypothetical protein JOB18_024920 [Solea senegalensis]|uniref:Uncharacterized protein n=1 Tax=Solea senegalensis TaxID=28829 RepID=A0AAV6R6F7_SOLSE|nr:hypothetical protein JOB18_024920 [Solea senegalensis]